MRILGISAFYHDSAAALVVRRRDRRRRAGRALHPQEARCRAFPRTRSTTACEAGGIDARRRRPRRLLRQAVPEVRAAARDLPRLRAARLHARSAWRCRSGSRRSCSRRTCCARSCKRSRRTSTGRRELLFAEHHLSHAASAFYPSPFEEAAVLTMDGVGEWATTSAAIGRGNELEIAQGDPLPAFARPALLGLHLLHRLQGQLRRVQGDGARALRRAELRRADPRQPDRPQGRTASFRLDLDYFDYCTGLTMTNAALRRAVRRAAAQAGRAARRSATWTSPPRSRR